MGLETASYPTELVVTNPVHLTDALSEADDHLRLIKSVMVNTFPNLDGPVNATPTEMNRLVGLTSAIVELDALLGDEHAYTAQQYFSLQTLASASNIAWDVSANQVAKVTLTGNAQLNNPTNPEPGAQYLLIVYQDGTGGRQLTFGNQYKFPGGVTPELDRSANAINLLSFIWTGNEMLGMLNVGFA